MTAYTFISYEKADATPALELCELLEATGLVCWIAPRDIPPGASYAATLYNGVAEAAALVLLLSATTNDSPHVLREVELAVSKRPPIPIITVRLDASDPSPDFKYHLTSLQWIEAAGRPLAEWGAVVGRVLGARLGPAGRRDEPVEPPAPIAVAEPPASHEPPAAADPVEPVGEPAPRVPAVALADRPPTRPPSPPERDGPVRRPERRRVSRSVVVSGIAAVAVAGVGVALALAGGGGSGDKTTARSAATTTSSTAIAAAAATTASIAPTTQTGTAASVPHTSDTPKTGWAPASAKELFAFARTPQDGIVDYGFAAAHQTFTIVVHGSDLIVDVRYATGATSRIWTRYAGSRLANACVFRRDDRTRCGSSAAALKLTSEAFQTLRRQRDGYYDALVSLPDLRPLRTGGSVGAVAVDDALGYAVRCAEPAGAAKLRLCVQENGFVTEMRAGANRITATAVRLGASAASLRPPV